MKKELQFVGLDVHAKSLTLAEGGVARPAFDTLPNDRQALEKVFTRSCGSVRA